MKVNRNSTSTIYLTVHQAFKNGKLYSYSWKLFNGTHDYCVSQWQLWGVSLEGSSNTCVAKKWLLHKAKYAPVSPTKYTTCNTGSSQNCQQFNKKFYTFCYDEKVKFFISHTSFRKLNECVLKKVIKKKGKWQNSCLTKSRVLLTETTISLLMSWTGRCFKPFTQKGLKTVSTS